MIKELYGKKLGMTQIFTEEGDLVGVTILEIEPACVLEKVTYPTKEKVRIGCFKVPEKKVKKIKKPQQGYFKKLGTSFYRLLREVDFDPNAEIAPLQEIGIDIFQESEIVDVQGKMKGRGFQGGVRRHGWRGQPRTHGHTMHRRLGSAGANTFPGRIIKGLKMPGHMGDVYRTVRKVEIVKVDTENNLLFIKGAVPGSIGGVVSVRKR
ncbi:MAG: 50S ribosomal protein L3 [Candidatus Omnitrophica bacterium]|nr:50S ribosomal protein L3 [Candidatus Omnitrophota bacterium]